jgi:Kef-type K+ transport system membrane component KefB
LGGHWAFRRVEASYLQKGKVTTDILALVLLLVLGSSWLTETLGIHALFGAFLIGVVAPKQQGFVRGLADKLEDFIVVLLLPLFFAFTGLRTSIALLNGVEMWFYCGLIIFVAIVGKFGGSTIAARLSGMPWREASSIGILMNTRGLIELVLLNIGLDIGVLSPALFAMMVLMALVTTFMTAPILEWIYFRRFMSPRAGASPAEEIAQEAGE